MTWRAYLTYLLISAAAFAGVTTLAQAARGRRGWWAAWVGGTCVLMLWAALGGMTGRNLALYAISLLAATAAAAIVVRLLSAERSRLLVPFLAGTAAYVVHLLMRLA